MINSQQFPDVDDGRALAQAIVDTVREPLLVLNKDLSVVAASRSFYLTFKVNPEDVQGRKVYALGNGQWNIPDLRLLLEEILPRHTVMDAYEVEHDFSDIGKRTMLLNARAVFNQKNANTLILLAIEDVTARRAIEAETTELLAQKEILLQEMQHRVANSLQIIASILLLKAKTVQSEEIRLHLHDAHQRVMSVAAVQQQLHASAHGEQIELAPYLSRLCDALSASLIGDSRPISLKVQAGNGTATSAEAVSIGLIVTELVINALKHAFVDSKSAGQIIVLHEVVEKNWRLVVSDDGVGKLNDQSSKKAAGLGTNIVAALAKQLNAHVETSGAAGGTAVSIVHGSFGSKLPQAA